MIMWLQSETNWSKTNINDYNPDGKEVHSHVNENVVFVCWQQHRIEKKEQQTILGKKEKKFTKPL